MAITAITALGPLGVEVDGRPVALGGPQQRAVFAALVLQADHVVNSDELVDRLWPDDPPTTAAKSIQKQVSSLRGVLGSDAIETVGRGYRLVVDPERVDLARFERGVSAASRADDPARRLEQLLAVNDEWDGAPFADAGDLEFIVAQRQRLERTRVRALTDLCELQLDLGSATAAISTLEQLAVEHPEDERVTSILMRALYRTDRHIDALRAFRRIERYLREELGVDPSPDLVELEAQILRHDPVLRPSPPDQIGDHEPHEHGAVAPAAAAPPAAEETTTYEAVRATAEEIRPVVAVVAHVPSPHNAPDEMRTARDRLAAELAPFVEASGGRLQRSAGGHVVAVFGFPTHEDAAARAYAVGEEVVRIRPDARVGIATGDAVVSVEASGEIVAGDVIDHAHALVLDTEPGEVAVSPHVDAMLSWRDRDEDVPVVGRETELDVVRDLWRRVVEDGTLRVLEVSGDAGIGKTRLIQAAAAALEPRPAHVLQASFSSFDSTGALAAPGALLDELASEHGGLDGWLAGLDITAQERAALLAHLAPFVDRTDDRAELAGGRTALAHTFTRMVELLASTGPLLITLEDVHWAPSGFSDALSEASLTLAGHPILTVLTSRPQPHRASLQLDGVGERSAVRLGPLSHPELQRLAEGSGYAFGDDVTADIAARSGGSPLFFLQYLRMVDDLPDHALEDTPPDSVRLVITARLDHLAPTERSTLQAASVLQRPSQPDALAAVAGIDVEQSRTAVSALLRAGLLQPLRTAADVPVRPGESAVEFHHVVVSDVAYAQLPRARRSELHLRAARFLDGEGRDSLDDRRAAAWHWRQVVQLTTASGRALEEEHRSGARFAFERAGDRLLHVDAAMATHAYDDALALAPERSAERAMILLRLGVINTDAGHLDDAARQLTEAADIFDESGDSARTGEALARLARALWFLGEGERLDALLEQALSHLERTPPGRSHAHAYVINATQTALRGDPQAALRFVEHTRPIAEAHGTHEDVIRLLHARGMARFDLDDPGGTDDVKAALDESLQHGFSRLASQSYNNLAELMWQSVGLLPAKSLAVAGVELAEARGLLGQVSWHRGQIAELDFDLGDWDAVLTTEKDSSRLNPMVEILLAILVARIRFWRGDDDQIEGLARHVDAARSTHTGQVTIPALTAYVSMAARLGQTKRADDAAQELLTLTAHNPLQRLREAGDAVRGLVHIGYTDQARALISAERPHVLRRALMWDTASAAIAEHESRWDDAGAAYRRAENGWRHVFNAFEATHAALGLARVAAAAGDASTAADAQRRARADAARLGATRLLSDVEHLG